MKYSIAFIVLTAFSFAALSAEAQPAYQYNDRYRDQRYVQGSTAVQAQGQQNKKSTLWYGGPPAQQPSDDTVVSSPGGSDRPLTEEEMRNAKPMGMYIDAPRPLPRGGNQPAPEIPQSTPSGAPQWQPGVAPGATEGYSGGSR